MMTNLLSARGSNSRASGAARRCERCGRAAAGDLRRWLRSTSKTARVLMRGRGVMKRWLIDPSLRFLAGGPK